MARERLSYQDMADILIEYGICSEDFVLGAICVGGRNVETMERVLFYNTGYRHFDRLLEDLEEEED